MFLTITIETKSGKADIRIDSEQLIIEGLRVLQESGKFPTGKIPDYFRSHMNQRLVSSWKTYEEERIYDGDILSAIED